MFTVLFSKSSIKSALIILFISLQITACSTEELGASGNNANNNDINNPNEDTDIGTTNQPAVISGSDTGNVTEDNDPDGNGLLETTGKLDITDADAGEANFKIMLINGGNGILAISADGTWSYTANNVNAGIQALNGTESLTNNFVVSSIDGTTHTVVITINGADETNQSAVISGVDTGSVTEDNDPDNNGLLEVAGKLNITDADAGEASFNAKLINGGNGTLAISADGTWSYTADNTNADIQTLNSTESLTNGFIVSSIDGTAHTIVITIHGADETSTSSADILITWVAPAEREDNEAILLSDISGYKIYYGNTQGNYSNSVYINDSTSESYMFSSLPAGAYYFVVTTLDTDGRESKFSTEVVVII